MTRLDRGIVGAFLTAFLAATLLFTLAIVFAGLVPSIQYLDRPQPGLAVRWIAWQFPSFLVQAMPIGVVMAALVSVGRLVRDRELLAMRAGGIPARRPVRVLVLVGAVLATVSLAAQQWALPRAATEVSEAWWRLASGRPAITRLEGRTWFVGTGDLYFREAEGHELRDVRFTRRSPGSIDVVRADRARFDGQTLVVEDARVTRLDLAALDELATPTDRLDALVAEHRSETRIRIPTHVTRSGMVARYSRGSYEDGRSLTDLWRSARNELRTPVDRREDWIRLHRKVVESLANVAILAVAVPLAIRYATSAFLGFGLTLGTAVLWYAVIAGGELLARAGLVPAGSIPWGALVAFFVLGFVAAGRLERV